MTSVNLYTSTTQNMSFENQRLPILKKLPPNITLLQKN